MSGKDIPEKLELVFKDQEPADASRLERTHEEVGSSSLCGRVGDNVTFHTQGCYVPGHRERMWSWAWRELGQAFLGLLRLFSFREK